MTVMIQAAPWKFVRPGQAQNTGPFARVIGQDCLVQSLCHRHRLLAAHPVNSASHLVGLCRDRWRPRRIAIIRQEFATCRESSGFSSIWCCWGPRSGASGSSWGSHLLCCKSTLQTSTCKSTDKEIFEQHFKPQNERILRCRFVLPTALAT